MVLAQLTGQRRTIPKDIGGHIVLFYFACHMDVVPSLLFLDLANLNKHYIPNSKLLEY